MTTAACTSPVLLCLVDLAFPAEALGTPHNTRFRALLVKRVLFSDLGRFCVGCCVFGILQWFHVTVV